MARSHTYLVTSKPERPISQVPEAGAVPGPGRLVHLALEVVVAELGGALQLDLHGEVLKRMRLWLLIGLVRKHGLLFPPTLSIMLVLKLISDDFRFPETQTAFPNGPKQEY